MRRTSRQLARKREPKPTARLFPTGEMLAKVPLTVLSFRGAGAEMRVALGTAVFSGMLGVTIFGIFFTPVFYSVVMWFSGNDVASGDESTT